MALHRATQSAIWYYMSCTPCAESRYRKKLKEKGERDRIEREATYTLMPHVYRHPSPSGTNPHWQTEIETGPHMISRGKKKPNTTETRGRARTSITQHSNGSYGPTSLDLSSSGASRDGRNDSKFDFKQYQRDDGQPEVPDLTETLNSNASLRSVDIVRPPRARIRGADAQVSYTDYRNPQLNDLHPATVTKFNSREETRFMLKPLPDPDFMKGRMHSSNRSRSDSGQSSRVSVKSPVSMSREVSQKMADRKMKGGQDLLTMTSSHGSSSQISNDTVSQPYNGPTSGERAFAESNPPSNDQKQASPPQIRDSDNSEGSAATVIHRLDIDSEPPAQQRSRRLASKPQLSTILSDNTAQSVSDFYRSIDELPKENDDPSPQHSETSTHDRDRKTRNSDLLAKDDSLKILRDLAPASAIFNSKVVSTDDLLKVSKRTQRHPSQASEDRSPDLIDPEIFESWDSADFALPEWIHEHTKREVKQRWSMDI